MSTLQAILVALLYPMQMIFLAGALYLAYKERYSKAAYFMTFSIMALLMARLP